MPTVLIIAGGDISERVPYVQAVSYCPALLPLHTRPLASYVIDFYGTAHDIHLFVDHQFHDEVRREIPPLRMGYQLHGIPPTAGVIDSIREALDRVNPDDDVIVNVVTTIPVSEPESNEIQIATEPIHKDLMCAAIMHTDGNKLRFFPKGHDRPNEACAFTGVFRLAADTLRGALHSAQRVNDLLSVIEQAEKLAPVYVKKVNWIDCGHEINYYKSRAAVINCRSFNRLCVDSRRGTIVKSSGEINKLSNEVAYLETLTPELRILYPRIVSVSRKLNKVDAYEMEYYGYPTLAEYMLYWNLSKDSWWRCFESLDSTLTLFRQHRTSVGMEAYRQFHWTKTISRIDQYLESLQDKDLRNALGGKSLKIGNSLIAPLPELLSKAEKVILNGYRENEFSIVHGDFCFNNILFDVISGIIRLIDPRGSFGDSYPGNWGDRRYDLAKLSHSSIGSYDYMVNGLFTVNTINHRHFELEFCHRPNLEWLSEMTNWLIQAQNADSHEISVMTALLFLSMCPLHSEEPSRQLALFLSGIELLNHTLT